MARKVRWWVGCVLFFAALFITLVDIWRFAADSTTTVSYTVSQWTGASRESVASALLGFVFGALLIHFTGWTSKPPDEGKP